MQSTYNAIQYQHNATHNSVENAIQAIQCSNYWISVCRCKRLYPIILMHVQTFFDHSWTNVKDRWKVKHQQTHKEFACLDVCLYASMHRSTNLCMHLCECVCVCLCAKYVCVKSRDAKRSNRNPSEIFWSFLVTV